MSKTNDLRKAIDTKLKTVCNDVFYEIADDKAMYPHLVFSFGNIDISDMSRDDLILVVDAYDKSKKAYSIEQLCDSVEALFNNCNLPQTNILPTFYRVSRLSVPDEDKQIRHRVLKFTIQNYERN